MNPSLRIISYNIHKGFAPGNTRFLLNEIRHSIRLLNADLVFLQEVVGENRKHQRRIHNWTAQQFEYLADGIWPHHAYGKNAIYDHGHHGNAILSQFPFATLDNINVSHVPTSQRGILSGTIHVAQCTKATLDTIHVICLHFGLLAFERRQQIRTLCEHVQQHIAPDQPLIIAGDFNDWRGEAHRELTRQLNVKEACFEKHRHLAKTFPARLPLLAMDRIYFRNLQLVDAEVLNGHPWNDLSDHCALYAEFSLA